jgi:hypothetical protein
MRVFPTSPQLGQSVGKLLTSLGVDSTAWASNPSHPRRSPESSPVLIHAYREGEGRQNIQSV